MPDTIKKALENSDNADFFAYEESQFSNDELRIIGLKTEKRSFDSLAIPEYCNGKAIVELNHDALSGLEIKELIIPATIIYIEGDCFANSKIDKVIIKADPTIYIDQYAFVGCQIAYFEGPFFDLFFTHEIPENRYVKFEGHMHNTYIEPRKEPTRDNNIEKIIITSKRFDKCVFSNCHGLKDFIIPSYVKQIESKQFANCDNLENIVFENGSKCVSILNSAFANCTKLKSIILPEGLLYIDNWAFRDCSNLENISIPSTVNVVKTNAFHRCFKLNLSKYRFFLLFKWRR